MIENKEHSIGAVSDNHSDEWSGACLRTVSKRCDGKRTVSAWVSTDRETLIYLYDAADDRFTGVNDV